MLDKRIISGIIEASFEDAENKLITFVKKIEPDCAVQRTSAWYINRISYIGGSEIGTLLNVDKYREPHHLLADKHYYWKYEVDQKLPMQTDYKLLIDDLQKLRNKTGNSNIDKYIIKLKGECVVSREKYMRYWGLLFEPIARMIIEKKFDTTIYGNNIVLPERHIKGHLNSPDGFCVVLWDNKKKSVIQRNNLKFYSLQTLRDDVMVKTVLLEIKCPIFRTPIENKLPSNYRPQVLSGLSLSQDITDFALYIDIGFRKCSIADICSYSIKYDKIFHSSDYRSKKECINDSEYKYTGVVLLTSKIVANYSIPYTTIVWANKKPSTIVDVGSLCTEEFIRFLDEYGQKNINIHSVHISNMLFGHDESLFSRADGNIFNSTIEEPFDEIWGIFPWRVVVANEQQVMPDEEYVLGYEKVISEFLDISNGLKLMNNET